MYLSCCRPHREESNITNICDAVVIASRQQNVQLEHSSLKTRLRKAGSLGIKCVSLLDVNFEVFSLSATYIASACCY